MWTTVTLHVRLALDLAQWSATAVWVEDDNEEPVTLHQTGTVRVDPEGGPGQVLQRVVAALNAAVNRPADR